MWRNLPIFLPQRRRVSLVFDWAIDFSLHIGRGLRDPVHEARHSTSLRLCGEKFLRLRALLIRPLGPGASAD
jgi:hypothetical protein